MMRVAGAAFAYFATVFVAAFALGAVRTFWLEPAIGETWAVACEAPLLVLAMYLSVRHIVPRFGPPRTTRALLGVGVLALVLQQSAEMILVRVAGETLAQHLAYLTTPAGLIYLGALAVFVALPVLLMRGRA